MTSVIEKRDHVRTKGAAEMLVKRRLGVIGDIITEYGLNVTVRFVPSVENKADHMTRVPKRWLGYRETGEEAVSVVAASATGEGPEDAIWAAHLPHHLGIDRTLFLARQIDCNLTRQQVKQELAGCEACQRIEAALQGENMVPTADLSVDSNWFRVAVDVTHFNGQLYLSMVDCGPLRVAIWRRLQTESAMHIIAQLRSYY